jgi:chorismate synthase
VGSIQAIKGVSIGDGFANASRRGTEVHDRFELEDDFDARVTRASNRGGGIEGGISTGMPITVQGAMKPISTTLTPLQSVDLATGSPATTKYERSDICAVPRAAVVGEAMVAFVIADALLEKLGGDSLAEMALRFDGLRTNRLDEIEMDDAPLRLDYGDEPD